MKCLHCNEIAGSKSGLCRYHYNKQYRELNSEKRKQLKKDWQEANKDQIKEYVRQYSYTNKNKINARRRATRNDNDRYHFDVNFKLKNILRKRVGIALKNNQKSGSAIKDLGCSIEELKLHIQSLWEPEMTWNNWSRNGWHIDHVVPLCQFDLSNREEFLKACHYTNLKPLWAKDNLSKGGK